MQTYVISSEDTDVVINSQRKIETFLFCQIYQMETVTKPPGIGVKNELLLLVQITMSPHFLTISPHDLNDYSMLLFFCNLKG